MSNFLFGCFVGFSAASLCWIAFMLHIANRTGAKAGE